MRATEMSVSQNNVCRTRGIGPFRRNAPSNAKRTWEVCRPGVCSVQQHPVDDDGGGGGGGGGATRLSCLSSLFHSFPLALFHHVPPTRLKPMFNSPCWFPSGGQNFFSFSSSSSSSWGRRSKGPERNRPHPHRLRFFDSSSSLKGILKKKQNKKKTSTRTHKIIIIKKKRKFPNTHM